MKNKENDNISELRGILEDILGDIFNREIMERMQERARKQLKEENDLSKIVEYILKNPILETINDDFKMWEEMHRNIEDKVKPLIKEACILLYEAGCIQQINCLDKLEGGKNEE